MTLFLIFFLSFPHVTESQLSINITVDYFRPVEGSTRAVAVSFIKFYICYLLGTVWSFLKAGALSAPKANLHKGTKRLLSVELLHKTMPASLLKLLQMEITAEAYS